MLFSISHNYVRHRPVPLVPRKEAHLHLLKVEYLLLAGLGLDVVELVGEAAEDLAATHLREEECVEG